MMTAQRWIAASLMLGLMVTVTPMSQAAEKTIWTDDVKAAFAQAKAENKDVLIDFSGSDWCGWCIKLNEEVFDKSAFKEQAPKDFVLVKLDFPRSKQLPEAIQKQNAAWAEKLNVQGFPTIVLLDADQRPYARTGYQEGGPTAYLESLKKLQQQRVERDKLLTQAASATGVEKAKLIDQALSSMDPSTVMSFYSDQVDAVIASDKDNAAGLKEKYEGYKAEWTKMQEMMSVQKKLEEQVVPLMEAGKHDEALTKLDGFVAQSKDNPDVAQLYTVFKAQVYLQQQNLDKAIEVFEQAVELSPESKVATQLKAALGQLKMMKAQMESNKPQQ